MGNNRESYAKIQDENMRLKIENMKLMDKIEALKGSADFWKAEAAQQEKAAKGFLDQIKRNALEGYINGIH